MSPRSKKAIVSFEILPDGRGYRLREEIHYHSERYGKACTVEKGFVSDGGSGPAEDIVSRGWWVHDKLCTTWAWDDGTPCSNRQASAVLYDILKSEGRWFRARTWFLATWLFGPIRFWRLGRGRASASGRARTSSSSLPPRPVEPDAPPTP